MSYKAKKFKEKAKKYEESKNKKEDFGVNLCMWYFDQCDPKRCSGMKLKQLGYVTALHKSAKFGGVVLTPTGEKMISLDDHDLV